MALSFVCDRRIYIVLDEENIERIQQHDPFDLPDTAALGGVLRLPPDICIAYATKDEYDKLRTFTDPRELVKYLRRGFRVTASDYERATPLKTFKTFGGQDT